MINKQINQNFKIIGESKKVIQFYSIYDKYLLETRFFFFSKRNILRANFRKMVFGSTAIFYDAKKEDFNWRGFNGEKLKHIFPLRVKSSLDRHVFELRTTSLMKQRTIERLNPTDLVLKSIETFNHPNVFLQVKTHLKKYKIRSSMNSLIFFNKWLYFNLLLKQFQSIKEPSFKILRAKRRGLKISALGVKLLINTKYLPLFGWSSKVLNFTFKRRRLSKFKRFYRRRKKEENKIRQRLRRKIYKKKLKKLRLKKKEKLLLVYKYKPKLQSKKQQIKTLIRNIRLLFTRIKLLKSIRPKYINVIQYKNIWIVSKNNVFLNRKLIRFIRNYKKLVKRFHQVYGLKNVKLKKKSIMVKLQKVKLQQVKLQKVKLQKVKLQKSIMVKLQKVKLPMLIRKKKTHLKNKMQLNMKTKRIYKQRNKKLRFRTKPVFNKNIRFKKFKKVKKKKKPFSKNIKVQKQNVPKSDKYFDDQFDKYFDDQFDKRFNERFDKYFDDQFDKYFDDQFDKRFDKLSDEYFNEYFDNQSNTYNLPKSDTYMVDQWDKYFPNLFDNQSKIYNVPQYKKRKKRKIIKKKII